MAPRKPKPIEPSYLEQGNAEISSGEPGEDATVEGFVPAWLQEQFDAPTVPINQYAEYQAANFADETPANTDVVHGADGDTPATGDGEDAA